MALITGPRISGGLPNTVHLAPGSVYTIPQGSWSVRVGMYTSAQYQDPISNIWRAIGNDYTGGYLQVYSDGQHYRLANQTGATVGALVTSGGSNYLQPPVVVPSAGGSTWRALVGGAVSTSVQILNPGRNYTYPPIVRFAAPPAGGVMASGYATLSGGSVSAIVVVNQGAGYVTNPAVSLVNDPREAQFGLAIGQQASALTTLTGAGAVTALLCLDHGQGGLASLPTLEFVSGFGSGATATAIMCWTTLSYTVTNGGTGYVGNVVIRGYGGFPTDVPAFSNPYVQSALVSGRDSRIQAALSNFEVIDAGQVVIDGGIFPGVPTLITSFNDFPQGAVQLTWNLGGVADLSEITPL